MLDDEKNLWSVFWICFTVIVVASIVGGVIIQTHECACP